MAPGSHSARHHDGGSAMSFEAVAFKNDSEFAGAMRLKMSLTAVLVALLVLVIAYYTLRWLLSPSTPAIFVPRELTGAPDKDAPIYSSAKHDKPGFLSCKDPSTGVFLGHVQEYSPAEVESALVRAREAQAEWHAKSTFAQRKQLLRVFNKFILQNARTICEVAARDSGKPMVDAAFGEVMVTCEKAMWLVDHGERWLRPERRAPGRMMFYKTPIVEYEPVGVVGTIVPWNYPFHNIFNPLLAAVFAGNAVVIKVSEHSSWSTTYYQAIIDAALSAVHAPSGLIQLITGKADTGRALVRGGCDKLIFIGSTTVGRHVMRDAADRLTPVTLELGGKDPFIVCDDVSVAAVVPTALRAAFQSCGQNCVAAERFIVMGKVYEKFISECVKVVSQLRQGNPLGDSTVDCGAMCLPGLAERVHELVEDARQRGARVLTGGQLPSGPGQFYPPTIVADVTRDMRVFQEEAFGPIMCIIKCTDDDDAVSLANNCAFGLGSSCFSGNQQRAYRIGKQVAAGMFVVNDFSSNAMCQSLPFGGVKESGFDRFNGIEGLRGMCVPKVVLLDTFPALMQTALPPPLQYPVASYSFDFVHGLCKMFYGASLLMRLGGIATLTRCTLASLFPALDPTAKKKRE